MKTTYGSATIGNMTDKLPARSVIGTSIEVELSLG